MVVENVLLKKFRVFRNLSIAMESYILTRKKLLRIITNLNALNLRWKHCEKSWSAPSGIASGVYITDDEVGDS